MPCVLGQGRRGLVWRREESWEMTEGTYGLAVWEADGEDMSGRLIVVARSVVYKEMAGTA